MPECKSSRVEQVDRIQALIAEWERNARLQFECADRTVDQTGQRVMDHGAFIYFNCAQALKDAMAQTEKAMGPIPVIPQPSPERRR